MKAINALMRWSVFTALCALCLPTPATAQLNLLQPDPDWDWAEPYLLFFPHYAAGGGGGKYTSDIVIQSVSNVPVNFRIRFWGKEPGKNELLMSRDGAEGILGGARMSNVRPGDTTRIRLTWPVDGEIRSGAVRVELDKVNGQPGAVVSLTFRYIVPVMENGVTRWVTLTEATVDPIAVPLSKFSFYNERSSDGGDTETGIAFANPNSFAVGGRFVGRDKATGVVYSCTIQNIPAETQVARFIGDMASDAGCAFPALFSGTIDWEFTAPILPLPLKGSGQGRIVISTVPVGPPRPVQ